MIAVHREAALADPCCHAFLHGRGYHHVGAPAMPATAVHPPQVAKPPAAAADMSRHILMPPQGGDGVVLTWWARSGTWVPVLGTGIRMGFSPDYLAAHGWKYQGPKV
jgi:hypothetical protein